MSQTAKQSSEKANQSDSSAIESQSFVKGLWGVRYQVKDVKRSVDFYTQQLGLKLDMQNLPAFAQVSVGNLKLILSGPGAFGFPPDARWSVSRTRWMEPRDSSSRRSSSLH